MRKEDVHLSFMALVLSLFLWRCANPTTPQGGPRDVDPPEVTSCIPPNYSTMFDVKTIHIDFNEFISLKSSGNEILLSPPLPDKPEAKARGKTIVVNFEDTLAPQTTYILVFENAIADITENNLLPEFRYVFSTGNILDSLTITGSVTDAFTRQAVPGVFVLLYPEGHDSIPADSLPYLVLPRYITTTNQEGMFRFTNLRHEAFQLFALQDQSGDYRYNIPSELIAFSDSLIHPWPESPASKDTSDQRDTLQTELVQTHNPVHLRLFQEVDSTQVLLKTVVVRKDHIRLSFRYPAAEIRLIPLNADSTLPWYSLEYSSGKDTVHAWITSETTDTLVIRIEAGDVVFDTVTLATTPQQVRKRQKSEDPDKPPTIDIACNARGGSFNHFTTPLTAEFSYPVAWYDPTRLRLITAKDTVIPEVSFQDSLHRFLQIRYSWQEGESYTLFIPDSSFVSMNGLTHDTIHFPFRTPNSRDLGSLIINAETVSAPGPWIIMLLDEKGNKVSEKPVTEKSAVAFPYITPGKYQLKAILDANKNGHWDTGVYLKKIQPEQVFLFPKTLEVRGNWEVEEDWKL